MEGDGALKETKVAEESESVSKAPASEIAADGKKSERQSKGASEGSGKKEEENETDKSNVSTSQSSSIKLGDYSASESSTSIDEGTSESSGSTISSISSD